MQNKNLQEKGTKISIQPGSKLILSIENKLNRLPKISLRCFHFRLLWRLGLKRYLSFLLRMISLRSKSRKKKKQRLINCRKFAWMYTPLENN